MTDQITKGPWKTHHLVSYTEPGWVILWPDTSKPGIHHRRLDDKGHFNKKDARLIAAAPDLLRRLCDLVEGVEGLSNLPGALPARLKKARAAIAKALGDAS